MGINSREEAEISSLLSQCPDSTFFMEPSFTKLMADVFRFNFDYLISKDQGGRIRGIMPCFFLKSVLFGKRIVSLPFNFFGGCVTSSQEGLEGVLEQVRALSSSFLYCEIKNTNPLPDDIVKRYRLQLRRQFLTYELPLDDEKDIKRRRKKRFREKLSALERKLSNQLSVKRARSESELIGFYRLMTCEYLKKHHTIPLPFQLFSKFWETFISKRLADLFLLYIDGHLASGIIVLNYRKRMIYQWGAFNLNMSWASPLAILLDRVLHIALAEGMELFDFGLTEKNHDGLRFFKSRWGTEERWLHYYYFLSRAQKIPETGYHSSFLAARRILGIIPVWMGSRLPACLIRQLA